MASVEPNALVSTDWLAQHLNAPDIRVVDATYTLPTLNRNPRAEYEEAHIPGAVFFDIDDIADETSELPHTVPDAAKFSSRVRKLGLGDGVRIVCYDSNRFSASARAWWMFRMFGHDDVVVLDGGLGKWRADGHPVDDHPVTPSERHFTARQKQSVAARTRSDQGACDQPERTADRRPLRRAILGTRGRTQTGAARRSHPQQP